MSDSTDTASPRPSTPDGPGRTFRLFTTSGDPVRWLNDVLCLALLFGVIWYWEPFGGGRDRSPLMVVSAVAALTLPAVVAEVRRLPAWSRLVLGAWFVGLLGAVAFGVDRTDLQRPLLTYAIVPVIFLATARVWRRGWGPSVLLLLLVAGTGKYWHRSFLQWWGGSMRGGELQWLALDWHNQSAVLMAMLGLFFLAFALLGRRLLALLGGVLASAALAGVWLSGSRGGVLVAGLALVGVTAVAWRSHARAELRGWLVLPRAVAVLGVAVTLVLLLTGMTEAGSGADGQPLIQRDQPATTNALARLEHMEAAWRMFVERPLAGHGIGTYRDIAPEFTSPGANLTAYAHNQYLEVLAEGGLLFGLPFLVAMSASWWLVLGVARRPSARARAVDELRPPAVVGAAAALLVFLAHSAIDFDWIFPVLPALAASTLAIVWVDGTWDI